eukprot:2997715-Pleurochrysis_carterae.AAC.2
MHLVVMLVDVTIETMSCALFVFQKHRVASKLVISFDKCIEAVQASLLVAAGGANRVEADSDTCRQHIASGPSLGAQNNRSLLVEEEQLHDALNGLNTHQWQLKVAFITICLSTIPFLGVPPLWSKMTYCWLLQSIVVVVAQRYFALMYSQSRYREVLRRVQRV